MNENIPQTLEEIADGLSREAWGTSQHENIPDVSKRHLREALAVLRWREAWLRDAEPRLRPLAETPNDGDICAFRWKDGAWTAGTWTADIHMPFKTEPNPMITGWCLIKRPTVPLTHAEALRLLISDIRSLGSPPEQLPVALAKAEKALGTKP